jgi:hypothetical protein
MDSMLDDVARVLASPISRREAFGRISKLLMAAAFASVVGGPKPAQAANCTPPTFACGPGANQICCPQHACCNRKGNNTRCCLNGQCICDDGRCANSTGGKCPSGCTVCSA